MSARCGCRPGEFLCPEAVRLWQEVNRAWEVKDYPAYDKAMAAYWDHRIDWDRFGKEVI